MRYNINFDLISGAYLFITAFFYLKQVRIPSRRNSIFGAMLVCGIVSLSLDVFVAVLDPYAYGWPAWIVYGVNILFLLSTQLSGVLFFYYAINLTGTYTRMRPRTRVLILLPFAAVVALLLASPFTSMGALYLDERHVYHHGGAHLVLYAVMALYLVASLVMVLVRHRRLQRLKFYTVVAFLLATLIAMVIQLSNPYLLVNCTANAFALVLIYYILEAPGAHVDALTGALNRTALLPMVRDAYEEGNRCTLLVYALDALHIVNHNLGMKGGDEALMAFAGELRKSFPRANVLRLEGDVFGVLQQGGSYVGQERLTQLQAMTPSAYTLKAGEITLTSALAGINSEDCPSAQELMSLLEDILQQHRARGLQGVLLADGDYQAQLRHREAVEEATLRALAEHRVEVYYQPIHNAAGKLCALEALVRVTDPELGPLPTQELVELAEHNGSILRLGEQILRTACAFLREHNVAQWGLDHVGINLSAIQCVQSGLPQQIHSILAEYCLPERLIAFEVTETAAGALSAVRENMERLEEQGIHFLLDDFGTGYANFKNLTALPYRCIKLDKSLLWNAQASESRMRLLSGVVKIVHALGLTSLCEGVETEEQAELLRSLGLTMLQGYYFSRPLAPEALLDYARKAGVGA